MTGSDLGEEATLFPKTPGERLREYRESQGLTLAEVAARTRVPLRHLEAIEQSNFSGLPSHTYSVGFAKAYARAIGMDEVPIARDVRNQVDQVHRPPEYQPYEMQDPRRQPPKGVALAGAAIAVLVLIAVGLWYGTTLFRGDGQPVASAPAPTITPEPVAAAPTPAEAPSVGHVTLTASDIVWLRVYDADGKSLFEKEMQPGERYDVPVDANRPMINVGRPDKLQVTVNGSTVPPLGDGARAIKDVVISAEALLARGAEGAAAVLLTTPDTTATTAPPRRRAPTRSSNRRPTAEPAVETPATIQAPPTAAPVTPSPPTGTAPAP
ncbi:MAG: DUF4115 domain-containing protein [Sphingomonas sp.]|nr:DUF4115 domain-containing protein [Sphingomonas sp.]